METKRINEDTIQVLIDQDDLVQRGISLPELMGNQERVEDFFYRILDEVDVDHDFSPDEPLTFQVRPLQNNGLELLIIRGSHRGEELARNIKAQLQGYDDEPTDELAGDEVDEALLDPDVDKLERVVVMKDFEDFVALAAVLDTLNLTSDLYQWQDQYYLVLTFLNDGNLTAGEVHDRMAVVYEFVQATTTTAAVLKEHGRLVMEQTAIELARHYFA